MSLNLLLPLPVPYPEGDDVYIRQAIELHQFDIEPGSFILQDSAVQTAVLELGECECWLNIARSKRSWIGRTNEDGIVLDC